MSVISKNKYSVFSKFSYTFLIIVVSTTEKREEK